MRSVKSTVGSGRSMTATSTAAGLVAFIAGARPHFRIEVEIAARAFGVLIGQRRRHFKLEPSPGAVEEVIDRYRRKIHRSLVHAKSLICSAGAIGKNAPPDATPNITVPSMLRSSPSSTRSKNSARVTFAQRSRRT